MEDREGGNLGLIDFSIENDSLDMSADADADAAATSTLTGTDTVFNLDGHQISGTLHADKVLEMGQTSEQSENLPQLLETSEPAKKNGKCNLRKSLAWDSAFFTSAGVLDAEELTTMIEGGDKGVKHFLPGIQEDVHTSMDSISTLESDNLTLESLEAELFEDIRASIQKSSRTSNMATLGSSAAPEGKNTQAKASSTSKKVDLAAGKRPMPKSGVKMPSAAITGSGNMIKQSKNSPQVKQPVMKIRESTSSIPRPIKSISNVNPLPSVATKRASLSANHLKVEYHNANSTSVSLKGTQASKSTSLGGPRRGLPKSSSSSRPSSLASSTASKTESIRPSSSCGSSGSSSDNVGKSVATSARRNISKVNCSGPIPKTPSRPAPRSKVSAPTAGLSALMISSKLSSSISSSISPASSISEWSVDSSSSTSTLNQTTSRASIDASSSCRSSNGDMDLNIHVADKTSYGNRNQRTELSSQNLKKATAQTSSLSRPDSMKPSGLRMPSPKIGFFDGSKSVRTPNGGVQSQARLSTGFPKLGAGLSSPIGSSGKAKPGKLPPTKVVKASTNLKSDTRSSASPTLSKQLPSPSAKGTNVSKVAKNCVVKSPEVQPEVGESSCLQIEHERESGKLEITNNEVNMQEIAPIKEVVLSFPKGDITDLTLDTCVAEIKSHGGGKDAIHGLDYLKNKSPGETNKKAADPFIDQIDDLDRDFVAMDLQLAMQHEVAGNANSGCELRCSKPRAHELCSKQNFVDALKEDSASDLKEIVISPAEEGVTGSSLDACVGDIKPHGVDEDGINGQDDHKNKLSGEMTEMEIDHFGDQIDDLAVIDVIAKDLEMALLLVRAVSTESCCELSCSNPCAPELGCEQNFSDVQKEKPTAAFKEIVIPLQEGGVTDSSLDTCLGEIKPHGPGEDAIHEDDLMNKALGEANEKETNHFGDQVDDLAVIDAIAKDLEIALLKVIAESTESCCELSCSNPCAPELGCDQNLIDVQKEKPIADFKEIAIPLLEGGSTIDSSMDTCLGKIKPHGQGEDAIREDDLMRKATGETNEKETNHFGDQVDDLVRNFEAIDLQLSTQKEIAGSTKPCSELSCSNSCAPELFSKNDFIDVQKEEPLASSCENSSPDPCSSELCSEKNFIEVQDGPTAESGELSCSNPCALELCSEKKIFQVQKEEAAANSRTPLVEKNSLYSSEESDILTGSGIEAVEKIADLPSSEIAQKENI